MSRSAQRHIHVLVVTLLVLASLAFPGTASAYFGGHHFDLTREALLLEGFGQNAIEMAMRAGELYPAAPASRARGRIVDGFRYAYSTAILRHILVIGALIGTLMYEFQVSLPLLAEFTFHGDAASYAALTSVLGIGAVIGGITTASRKRTSLSAVAVAALLFGLVGLMAAFMPTFMLTVAGVLVLGFFSVNFSATANTTLQLACDPQMRGRIMALWSMAFLGSTTLGGPIIGFIGQHAGARWSLATGGLAALAAATYGIRQARWQVKASQV